MRFTRDSAGWWFGILGSIVTGVAVNLQLFPWIPDTAQHWITFGAFIAGIVSGKLATSPLPAKNDPPAGSVSVVNFKSTAPLLLLPAMLILGVLAGGCAKAQPQLTPQGQVYVTARQVVSALDVLRDAAVSASQTNPPLLSVADAQKVVAFHESAVKVIGAVPGGWKPTVSAALDQLHADLPSAEYQRIAPYVALVQALIAGIA